MKVLKIVLVTLLVLGGLIYFALWYTFRTTSVDVSQRPPFSEIVGMELITKQPCFIAINSEHYIKENSYIVEMKRNKFSSNATIVEKLPIGTKLKIKDAKEYRNGVTGFKSTYVLGSVFLVSLQREVPFEFAWGRKNFGTDLPGEYFNYALAPWQDVSLNIMYNYKEGIQVPYENYNSKKENTLENPE